jgi:hypothetical protein
MSGPIQDWKVKSVCGNYSGSCNNEWMNDIEKQARRAVEPLLGDWLVHLSEDDQKAIATWAILKVMVVHHRFVHHAQRKQMMNKRVPPKYWSVWIANDERENWRGQWLTRPLSVRPGESRRREDHKPAVPNSHATTQIIKNHLIHVIKLPVENFAARWRWTDRHGAPFKGTLLRIWPPSGQRIVWPTKALSDLEAGTLADALYAAATKLAVEQGLLAPR